MLHLEAFEKETELIQQLNKSNAHFIWAIGMYLDQSDLLQLASESLTDTYDDKKIDFIRYDIDTKKLFLLRAHLVIKN